MRAAAVLLVLALAFPRLQSFALNQHRFNPASFQKKCLLHPLHPLPPHPLHPLPLHPLHPRGSVRRPRRARSELWSGPDDDTELQGWARTGAKWVLSYADLSPYTEKDLVGALFLLTNACYLWAGVVLQGQGQGQGGQVGAQLGWVVEVAGVVSTYYHWCQLHYGPNRSEVVVALCIDYGVALCSIALYLQSLYVLIDATAAVPWDSVLLSCSGLLALGLSWVYEFSLPYIIFHGAWHVLSALGAAQLLS
ncbi:hypothetical protein B484DRAFT_457541 [Ochromonadaceae sp. CCMP2298]|nr:hypothetical protein B484DRAFT_457541 [Ochromonadaceae sp. CCMP2298]